MTVGWLGEAYEVRDRPAVYVQPDLINPGVGLVTKIGLRHKTWWRWGPPHNDNVCNDTEGYTYHYGCLGECDLRSDWEVLYVSSTTRAGAC